MLYFLSARNYCHVTHQAAIFSFIHHIFSFLNKSCHGLALFRICFCSYGPENLLQPLHMTFRFVQMACYSFLQFAAGRSFNHFG